MHRKESISKCTVKQTFRLLPHLHSDPIVNMKVTSASTLAFVGAASAAAVYPTPNLNRQWGYAKENPVRPTFGCTTRGSNYARVSTVDEFNTAANDERYMCIDILAPLNFKTRPKVKPNKTLYGTGAGQWISGAGLDLADSQNIIIRNLGFRNIQGGDAITISNTTNVWVDHCEFTANGNDGQLDIGRGSDWITVSFNYFHDHQTSSIVGDGPNAAKVNYGKLHVTYMDNYFKNIGGFAPGARFGYEHIYNNVYENFSGQTISSSGNNQMLLEANVFIGTTSKGVTTKGANGEADGNANLGAQNNFGKAVNTITKTGTFTKPKYEYQLIPLSDVERIVKGNAGIGKVTEAGPCWAEPDCP